MTEKFVNAEVSSDELLERIFTLTENLYKEMSKSDEDISNDHDAIFVNLTELGRTLVNADRVSFWKWDKRSKTLWTKAAVNVDKIVIPEGTGLVGKALAEKRTIVTNDPYNNPDFNSDVDKKTGYVTKSILVMPVSNCKGEFIGVYQAINKLDNDGNFDIERDTRRLSMAAFICGITLESEMFLDDSHHDKLTELKNRMGFHNDYARMISDMKKSGNPVSLFISDIDFFKKVNDTYGHNAGDAVLKHVAGILRSSLRDGDSVYRWGGEEFIMVFKNADMKKAAELADAIRLKVMDSVCVFEDLKIKVTMSFGVTQLDEAKNAEENISVADEKLYRAKEGGRNRVVI